MSLSQRGRSRLVFALFLGAALLAWAPAASGHAQLLSSQPMAGARLDSMPAQAMVHLSEAIDASSSYYLRVMEAAGQRVDDGRVLYTTDPPMLTVGLPAGLPDGAYVLEWHVISGDTHPTGGTIGFAVGAFVPPASSSQGLNKIDPMAAAARLLGYAGFSLVFASAVFLATTVRLGYPRQILLRAMLWGTTLHLAGALLLVSVSHDAGLSWANFTTSDIGRVLLTRLVLGAGAWILALLCAVRPTRTAPAAITLLMLGAGLASARLAHGYADGPVTMALDFTHLLSASAWVGGLLLFAWYLRRHAAQQPDSEVRALGLRFGTIALAAVIVLAFTGTIVSIAILGRDRILHPTTTLASAYGLLLAGKILVAAAMVAVAALNRYVFLEPPTEKGVAGNLQRAARKAGVRPLELGNPKGLGRAVALEAVMGCVVLVLAGFLTSVSPPAMAVAPPPTFVQQGEHYFVHLVVDPAAAVGKTSMLELQIVDAATGVPLTNNTCGRDSCVLLQITQQGLNGTESHVALPGEFWMVHDFLWTRPGDATVHVDIQSAEVFHDEVTFRVPVTQAHATTGFK